MNNTKKEPKSKAPKAKSPPAAKADTTTDKAPADRLPATLDELKASKAGLATFLFLSDKGKEEIAAELQAAFKLTDTQAVKIVRRITGRARFFQRALSLVAAK